jgi:hypothetical protein
MGFRISQPTIERLLYALLLIVFIAIVVGTFAIASLFRQVRQNETVTQQGVKIIEQEDYCLVAFFLNPDHSEITLKNLSQCQPIIQK